MSTLWAVLLSFLCVTVAKPYYENEGEFFDSRSFFQDDESVIQDEADFQYINEAEENMNLEFADEMSDWEARMENYGEIQRIVGDPEFTCKKGEYLSSVTLIKQTGQLLHDCTELQIDEKSVECWWEDSPQEGKLVVECKKYHYLAGLSYQNHRNRWQGRCCTSDELCFDEINECSYGFGEGPMKGISGTDVKVIKGNNGFRIVRPGHTHRNNNNSNNNNSNNSNNNNSNNKKSNNKKTFKVLRCPTKKCQIKNKNKSNHSNNKSNNKENGDVFENLYY